MGGWDLTRAVDGRTSPEGVAPRIDNISGLFSGAADHSSQVPPILRPVAFARRSTWVQAHTLVCLLCGHGLREVRTAPAPQLLVVVTCCRAVVTISPVGSTFDLDRIVTILNEGRCSP